LPKETATKLKPSKLEKMKARFRLECELDFSIEEDVKKQYANYYSAFCTLEMHKQEMYHDTEIPQTLDVGDCVKIKGGFYIIESKFFCLEIQGWTYVLEID